MGFMTPVSLLCFGLRCVAAYRELVLWHASWQAGLRPALFQSTGHSVVMSQHSLSAPMLPLSLHTGVQACCYLHCSKGWETAGTSRRRRLIAQLLKRAQPGVLCVYAQPEVRFLVTAISQLLLLEGRPHGAPHLRTACMCVLVHVHSCTTMASSTHAVYLGQSPELKVLP